ncbi:MAG: extracellular solute-binding protein [Anaerolineales bacterium]|nr:extracellular solute-binding protein [Anaerolineales bacterium]
MAEILFSLIGELTPTLENIIHKYEKQTAHRVKTEVVEWEEAWPQILSWALHENSPHVSHVGSTWATSLFRMNALRPFSAAEMRAMGSHIAFLPQAWQSAQSGGAETWAIPWGTYTFILGYRKDLLKKAGVDEQTAFTDFAALVQTLQKLREAGIQNPWLVPISPDHLDTLHYVASWVWDADGDFISTDGQRAIFDTPASMQAITQYFELLKYMKKVPLPLDEDAAMGMFVQGDAAVTIIGCGLPYTWINNRLISKEFEENLGFAPVPGVPWVGGDHLVIWKQARLSIEVERASVDFVRYLVSKDTQELNANNEDVRFPSRVDAFDSIPFPTSQLTQSVLHSLRAGRSYRPIAYWSKIEHQFARAFGGVGENIIKGTPPEEAVNERMASLATWFNAMLR